MTNAIEIAHLRNQYGEIVAVDDLSLSVPADSFFGFHNLEAVFVQLSGRRSSSLDWV